MNFFSLPLSGALDSIIHLIRKKPGGPASHGSYCLMLTCLRSRPTRSKETRPSTRANRVSSLPRPTFSPGWMCVPRWRTRMLPARTNWPSPRFTPRRFDSESRPFLCRAYAFFMCHILFPSPALAFDIGDFHFGERLAVAHLARRTLLGAVRQDVQLLALAIFQHLARDGRARNSGGRQTSRCPLRPLQAQCRRCRCFRLRHPAFPHR